MPRYLTPTCRSVEAGLSSSSQVQHPLVLTGRGVRLEPLAREHLGPLLAVATTNPELYRYTSTPTTEAEAEAYFARAFRERGEGTAYPFVLLVDGQVVGTSRYSSLNTSNRNCELGFTWLAPAVQGTGVNLESKYLMLRHAFETLDLLRVYFYTDARNERSARAIRKLGAVYEGTMRAERVMKDGHIRDTLLFSIIYTDWPEVKRGLEAQLSARLSSPAQP